MAFCLLLLFGVAAALSLGDARHLRGRRSTYWDLTSQNAAGAEPERMNSRNSRTSAQQTVVYQTQPRTSPMTWRFPEPPVDAVPVLPGEFAAPRPQESNRVAVRCGENRVQVELKRDLLNIGRPIRPEEITLGGCPPTEVDDRSHVIAFESELHGCGSRLVMMEDTFVYAFTLVYDPIVLDNSGISRSQRVVVTVECHYPRHFQDLHQAKKSFRSI